MAFNKRWIHFDTFDYFNSQKLSANKENTKYSVGVDGAIEIGSPNILWQSICWIKDSLQIWTHGALYNCAEVNLVPYLTKEEFEEFKELLLGETSRNDTQDTQIANLQEGIGANAAAIEVLNGAGDGSVKDTVTKEIANIIASSPEDLEKLREIADFIESDPVGAAQLSSMVSDHETRITQIESDFTKIVFMNEDEYESLLDKNNGVLYMLYEA